MSSVDQSLQAPQSEEVTQVSQPVEEPTGVLPQTVPVVEEPAQTEAEPKEEVKEEKPVKEKRKSAIGNLFGKLGKKVGYPFHAFSLRHQSYDTIHENDVFGTS
jgi:hypothetical protein